MNNLQIVILGGGSGGLAVAGRLKELLGDESDITVLDKEPEFVMGFSLLKIMVEEKTEQEVAVPKENIIKKGIKFVKAKVNDIDLQNRVVKTDNGKFEYDYLVIALGAELSPENIPGSQSAFHMYTLDAAKRLNNALKEFSGGSIKIVISSTPFKCPPAPYEAAMLIDDYLKKKSLTLREKSNIQIFTPEPFPMPVAGPEVGEAVVSLLNDLHIQFHNNIKISSIDSSSNQIIFENGAIENYDLLIMIPPHTSPQVIKESKLADESGGWIPVDSTNMQTKYDRVYAIGDVTSIKLQSGMMLPKAATFAFGQSETVAHNIASSILGLETRKWDGFGECFIETGNGKAAYSGGNFYSLPKPVINLQQPSYQILEREKAWGDYWIKRLL